MQSNVIDVNNQKHTIEPYHFKILRQPINTTEVNNDNQEEQNLQEVQSQPMPSQTTPTTCEPIQEQIEQENQVENIVQETKPSFIEELLKRTDELSDNIIKLQMKIENQENEFKERLENEVKKAKEEGKKEGFEQANENFNEQLTQIQTKYTNSIKKLNDEEKKLLEFLDKTEEQLSSTAIDIAKEVISKELSQNSKEVALSIVKNLISQLKEASDIQVKINPSDFEFIQQNLDNVANIKLSADEAITKGGALVLSSINNIDGTIQTRFNKIKKILSE